MFVKEKRTKTGNDIVGPYTFILDEYEMVVFGAFITPIGVINARNAFGI